ncbi:CpaF family protein [Brucella intermedia]|uniref:CpaF family protein n=1 Tax=Brucella intermedia TaxID=94625 RepID=UPI0004699508|nr:CpaF family protein [Brucella intermedia]
MFGKRPLIENNPAPGSVSRRQSNDAGAGDLPGERRGHLKANITSTLLKIVNGAEIASMPPSEARKNVWSTIQDIISSEKIPLSQSDQLQLIDEICDDLLGYGPLQPLLARDDIADIMINGPEHVYIEVQGRVQKTDVKFRDEEQLFAVCQRIASSVGRRVDEASPICDARLQDGSRVNIIAPPLSIDGTTLTIRKFRAERLTMADLVDYGTVSIAAAELLGVVSACRCNIIVSGGTGSGKTTLLNCLGAHISRDERVVTCEDAAELQLQQPHVVRLETRPLSAEGKGEVTMRDLVRNSLRMRPDRIVVGEVRGAEVMDLLQAMNTGHAGSMGTIHANTPRECLNRIETLMAIGGYQLPQKTIRELIVGAVDIIIQVSRLQDGTRKVTHITEVIGMEGDVIVTQDILRFEPSRTDEAGMVRGVHRSAGISRPHFYHKAAAMGLEDRLMKAFVAMKQLGT